MYPWRFSTGLESTWRGGPGEDADGERSGGYAMMDMSMFSDNPRDNFQRRGWIITELMSATSVTGRCVKFYHSMNGLNADSLRLIRVDIDTDQIDIDTEDTNNQTSIPTVPAATSQASERLLNVDKILTRDLEASLSFSSPGGVEVVIIIKLNQA